MAFSFTGYCLVMQTEARPPRLWRAFIIALVVCLVLALIAAVGLRLALPSERLAGMLGEWVERSTGRLFRINGDLSIHLLPTLAVVAHDVTLSNAEWGSRSDMLKIRRVAFGIALRPLLEGQVRVLEAELGGVEVLLEEDGGGRSNWQFGGDAVTGDEPAATMPSFGLERLLLSDAKIILSRRGKAGEDEIAVTRLELLSSLDQLKFSGAFAHAGRQWQIEGQTAPWASLFGGATALPLDLHLSTAGGKFAAKGSLGLGAQAGAFRGEVSVWVSERAALGVFVADHVPLPMPFEAAATVVRDGDQLSADPLRITMAGQHLQGRLAMRGSGSAAGIDGELRSPSIDVAKWLTTPQAPSPAGGGGTAVFTDRALPFALLPDIPLRLGFRIEQLQLPGLPALATVQGQMISGPARFALDSLRFKLADGVFAVRLGIDKPREAVPLTTLSVEAEGLSVEATDALFGPGGRFRGGQAGISANLRMQGATPRKMAASASGKLRISARNVPLTGKAANMQRNLLMTLFQTFLPQWQLQKGVTIQCAVLHLPLVRGVARINRSIALETEDMAISASGEVNLVNETLQLVFQPQVKKGIGLSQASLSQLVMLKGPLFAPAVGIDAIGTANQAATLGVAVATGGMSLLARRMLSERGNSEACRTAMATSGGGEGRQPGRRP